MAGEGALAILLVKPAKWQDAASGGTWVQGNFVLHPTKITWQPSSHAQGAKELHVGLISITTTQRAKTKPLLRIVAGTSSYTFEFGNELDRDSAVDAFTRAKDLLQQGQGSEPARAGSTGTKASAAAGGAQRAHGTAAGGQGRAAAPKAGAGYVGPLPDAAQKREMLRADAELGERYNTLVAASGVLTEEEFWAGVMTERSKAAAAAAAGGGAGAAGQPAGPVVALPPPPGLAEQQKGLSNAMFHVPVEQDGRTVSMRFTLTPDLIAVLFVEKPHVKRAYDANVPGAMSEKEFWTRYIKHELAKEERRKRLVEAAATAAGDAGTAPPPLEHTALFNEGEGAREGGAAGARRQRRKLAASDPLVNVAADDADRYSQGFGILHDANKEPVVKAGLRAMAEDLAHDINRHANVVLSGCQALKGSSALLDGGPGPGRSSAGGAGGSGGGEEEAEQLDELAAQRVAQYGSGLEDLRADTEVQFEVLHLREQPKEGRNDMQGVELQGQRYSEAGGGEVPLWLQHLDPNNLSHRPVNAKRACSVLLEVTGLSVEASGGGSAGGGLVVATQQAPDMVLAPALVSKLRTQVKMVCDVARHFWACMPPDTQERKDKAERLAAHVDSVLWDEIENTLKSANSMGGPQRPAVRALLQPARTMMEALLDRYKEEKERNRG